MNPAGAKWRCIGCGVETPGPVKLCDCASDLVHNGDIIERRLKSLQYVETMTAEMKPYCYAGKTCDRLEPRWYTYCNGDKEAGEEHSITLAARTFPAGTKISISEPLCPSCGERRSPKFPTPKRGTIYPSRCDCGFNWDAWALREFS